MSKALASRTFSELTPSRAALEPQRANGRERVALILQTAADVIAECGYDATTMKEIADRSDTRMGSLYRFFPTKDHIAETLLQKYLETSEAQWQSIIDAAPRISIEQLGTMLLDVYAKARRDHQAVPALLASGTVEFSRRVQFRAASVARIGAALRAHAPHLEPETIERIAVILLYNARTMNALVYDSSVPDQRAAIEELRMSVFIYLRERLKLPA